MLIGSIREDLAETKDGYKYIVWVFSDLQIIVYLIISGVVVCKSLVRISFSATNAAYLTSINMQTGLIITTSKYFAPGI